ncbi:MAG TPA: hypothetical protein VFR59_10595 [Steroidobacteraceae bacterium]|nr:hypothetical protein [Steroidobacteraceae bacterium]
MQTLEEVGRELLEDIGAGRIEGGSYERMIEWIARLAANELIPPFDYVSLLESLEKYGPH